MAHLANLYGVTKPIARMLEETKQSIECFKGSFFEDINGCISFILDTMYETVAQLVLEKDAGEVIQTAPLSFCASVFVLKMLKKKVKLSWK